MPMQPTSISFRGVVFILATLLGFASHAPGSIGLFDAAMLVALLNSAGSNCWPRCVFRILYFMIPFGIAISIMGAANSDERDPALAEAPQTERAYSASATAAASATTPRQWRRWRA